MQPWFRFYDDAVSDPKVQLLPAELFKVWINLLCLANKNNGALPDTKHIAYALHISLEDTIGAVTSLAEHGLLDRHTTGPWRPHNWSGRQFKSDSSTERMRRHRDRHRDRNGNAVVTPPEREKERETERDITPTGLYLSPEKESAPSQASEPRAPLEAPRARSPDGASKQEVAEDPQAQHLEIIRRRADRQALVDAILAKHEMDRTPFEKMILKTLQSPTP
jgi:hypothetical protein